MRNNVTVWLCDPIAIAVHITWCQSCLSHMVPLASQSVSHDANSIINGTIIFWGHDDKNEVQHDLFGHMMPLALASASHDAHSNVNSTTTLHRSRWLNLSATWLLWSCDIIGTSIGITQGWWALSMAPLHSLDQDNWNEVQPYSFGHAMPLAHALASHDTTGIGNGTTAFIRSRCSKLLWLY